MTPAELAYMQALLAQQGVVVQPYGGVAESQQIEGSRVPLSGPGQLQLPLPQPNAPNLAPQPQVAVPQEPSLPRASIVPPDVEQMLRTHAATGQPAAFPPGGSPNGVPAPQMPASMQAGGAMPTDAQAVGAQMPDAWGMANSQVPTAIMPGPPQTPEERDRRKSGWQALAQKIQSDPNLQALMLRMGTAMMQPKAPGQSTAGHIGQALQSGVDYAVQAREMRRKGELESQASARAERGEGRADKALTLQEQEQATRTKLAESQEARAGRRESREVEDQKLSLRRFELEVNAARSKEDVTALEKKLAGLKIDSFDETQKAEIEKLKAEAKRLKAETDKLNRGDLTPEQAEQVRKRMGAAKALQEYEGMIERARQEYNSKHPKQPQEFEAFRDAWLAEEGSRRTKWLDLVEKVGSLGTAAPDPSKGKDKAEDKAKDTVIPEDGPGGWRDILKKRQQREAQERNAPKAGARGSAY